MTTSHSKTIYTIGHSNRTLEDFLALLTGHAIEQVVDIRSLPGSRKYPYFDKENLCTSLKDIHVVYQYLPKLGGRRRSHKDSVNMAWRHPAFRSYADYMQTPEFTEGLETLIHYTQKKITTIMCAEAVPWRCHRSLVGDALLVRGYQVLDIIGPGAPRPHTLTPWAVVHGTEITYPGSAE